MSKSTLEISNGLQEENANKGEKKLQNQPFFISIIFFNFENAC